MLLMHLLDTITCWVCAFVCLRFACQCRRKAGHWSRWVLSLRCLPVTGRWLQTVLIVTSGTAGMVVAWVGLVILFTPSPCPGR